MFSKINWWWQNNILIEYYKQMEILPFNFYMMNLSIDRK